MGQSDSSLLRAYDVLPLGAVCHWECGMRQNWAAAEESLSRLAFPKFWVQDTRTANHLRRLAKKFDSKHVQVESVPYGKEWRGYNALHLAVGQGSGSDSLIKLLLTIGVNPHEKTASADSSTPFHICLKNLDTVQPETIRLLWFCRAGDLNKLIDGHGVTPRTMAQQVKTQFNSIAIIPISFTCIVILCCNRF